MTRMPAYWSESEVTVQKLSSCPLIVRDMGDRYGQLWFLGVSLSWRTFADRCGQVQKTLVPRCLSEMVDIWRTGADRCGQLPDNFQ